MAQKMATVERVEELLEKLRAASWDHAVKGTANRIVVLPLLFSSFGHSEEAVYFLVFFSFASLALRFVLTYQVFIHGSRTLPIPLQLL